MKKKKKKKDKLRELCASFFFFFFFFCFVIWHRYRKMIGVSLCELRAAFSYMYYVQTAVHKLLDIFTKNKFMAASKGIQRPCLGSPWFHRPLQTWGCSQAQTCPESQSHTRHFVAISKNSRSLWKSLGRCGENTTRIRPVSGLTAILLVFNSL